VDFCSFDEAYLGRLRAGDPQTEQHFVAYFSELIHIKLRARFLTADQVEELRQETFVRVLNSIRSEGGIRQPDRLGPFVNSVCNNVLQEHYRAGSRTDPYDESSPTPSDKILNIEGLYEAKQVVAKVRSALNKLPEKDRDLISAVFLEEEDKDSVCNRFGVDRDYLRVLLHRAREKFRETYLQEQLLAQQRVTGKGGA